MRSVVFLLVVLLCGVAKAAPQCVAQFGGWSVYRAEEKGETICFMNLSPRKSSDVSPARGDVVLSFTLRPAENFSPVVSFDAGKKLKEGSLAEFYLGKSCYVLFTRGAGAWARTGALDKDIADDVLLYSQLITKTVPEKGAKLVDEFDLKGTDKALRALHKICGAM